MPPATDAPAITRSAAIARRCRTCSSTCSSMRKAPRESVLDLDATPCTATRKAGSSTAIMTVTVICRSMCSAAVSCWRQNCGARTSTPRPAPRTRWRASSPASAGAGPRYGSCSAREELMAWCEEQRVDYLFGLARNSRLLDEIAIDLAWAEAEHQETGKPARRFKDFFYATRDSWNRRRRVIGKAEHLAKGANPRFIVTSLKRKAIDAQTLYEQVYCARGEMENRIKECQLDFVRRPHLDRDHGRQSAATVVLVVRLCAAIGAAPDRFAAHRAGAGDLRHHSPEAAQTRRPRY